MVHFAIHDDLRFLSHHDCMRLVERLAVRAGLPLRYSQGFNPHPVLSLLLPRPVGVATRDDLLVLALDGAAEEQALLDALNAHAPVGLRFFSAARMEGRRPPPSLPHLLPRPVGVATRDDLLVLALDGAAEEQALLDALNAHAPVGLRFFSAARIEGRRPPRPARAFYELELDAAAQEAVRRRLPELQSQAAWPAQRVVLSSRGERKVSRPIDLRPLVEGLELEAGRLRMTLVRQGDAWARPIEILVLVGLEGPESLARLVRTGCECESLSAAAHPPGGLQAEKP